MNPDDLNSMIKEIDEFIDDVKKEIKRIDPEKGKMRFQVKSFGENPRYEGTLMDNLVGSVNIYKKYKNSKDRWRTYYITKCHDWLTRAKIEGAIVAGDKTVKELNDCKENEEKKDKELTVKDDMINQLKMTNQELQEKIDTAIKIYPTLQKILYGNNESEVKEDV